MTAMSLQEPRNEADPGVIYMWIESLQYKVKKPRAYELPYSQKSHTRLTAAKRGKEFGVGRSKGAGGIRKQ